MINRETALIWSKMLPYKRLKQRTAENIVQMLQVCKKPYIAFSCGKDSTVLADMILRENPNITCRFISSGETRIVHDVDKAMSYFRDRYHADIEEIVFDRVFSEKWRDASFDEQRKAGLRDIQTIDNTKYDGVFMGLRIQESRGRAISLRMCRTPELPENMYKYSGREFYRMCPLAQWKTEDIGAYISENEIPMLDWYEVYGFEGRTTARITGDAVRQNVLFYIKVHNPAGYQRITERFPELML